MPRFTVDLSAAPEARKRREQQLTKDLKLCEKKSQAGAEARFRLQYGLLSEFFLAEVTRDTPLDHIVAGYGANIEEAIATLALNTKDPLGFVLSFVAELTKRLMQRLDDEDENMSVLDLSGGDVRDYDFRRGLRK
jgi:hypothetical protein